MCTQWQKTVAVYVVGDATCYKNFNFCLCILSYPLKKNTTYWNNVTDCSAYKNNWGVENPNISFSDTPLQVEILLHSQDVVTEIKPDHHFRWLEQ